MDEQQVRLLVRQAIARHLEAPAAPPRPNPPSLPPSPAPDYSHVSFSRFHLVRPAGETECLIEPTVPCNHCGHCLCYGH